MRPDYYFSYWLFFAFILYYFKVLSFNPKHFLILALGINICQFFLYSYNSDSNSRLFLFLIINFLIKVVPIYILWDINVNVRDYMFFIGLFLIYLLWLIVNGIDLMREVGKIKNNTKPSAPLTDFILSFFVLKKAGE